MLVVAPVAEADRQVGVDWVVAAKCRNGKYNNVTGLFIKTKELLMNKP
jgi:hypothetical protein